ncbi:trigger factor [Scopulibacillus daqui]|uniref:Trigger factor n=1 Tax=Scopulibacillus daqui TaxID=1469162 RepID=A0ABS2PXJ1_9BACL|nr:trigger factor [Scopulibacillus daqui]MBM7644742.1 trigger factor [Scopulibacillus daqui]
MDVTAKWEKQEGNQGTLTFEVDAESFNKSLDKAFKKVVKKVNVPGFRKGKVPRKIFEQRFGVESLYQDALDIMLPEAYSKAVDETGIEPVDRPEIDVEKIEQGSPVVLTAAVTVKPEVKLGEYKGLEVEKQDTEVTDEDVDNQIKQLQERFAELVVKEEGEVEEGNTAVIDFEGFVDGEPFEGGKAENYSLEVGSNTFIPGFEEQLVGLTVGAEKDVKVTFPEDYHAEELKGKEATFKVKLHEIKEKQLPELDDEFAKDVNDEVETLDELKETIKKQLKETKERNAENATRDTVVEKASENAEIDIPEAMIETELDRMVREFEQNIQSQGLTLDMYYQFSGTDQESLREQMKDDASKRVRANLTLEAIVKAENIEVSEEEIEKELEKMAENYKLSTDQVKQMLAMQGGNDLIKSDLQLRKAVDFLVEHSKVKAS